MLLRDHIRLLIVHAGFSLREFAQKCGVRRQSITHFLEGGNLHLNNLEKILNTLGYDFQIKARGLKEHNNILSRLKRRLHLDEKVISRFCKNNSIQYLAIYGSVLREDFKQKSDIDVLMSLEKTITYFELVALEEKLQNLFRSKYPVHLVTLNSLSPLMTDEIIGNMEVVYAKAA